MSDENVENQEEGSVPEQSTDELRARQHGWVPKSEWEGDVDEWVPAKVFNLKGELFGRIAKDKSKITELETAVTGLVEQVKKAHDAGYARALDELKAKKRDALDEGDTSAVLEIDDQIDSLKEEHKKTKEEMAAKVSPKTQSNPEFDMWHVDNEWYLTDQSTTAYANELVMEMNRNAQVSGTQLNYSKMLNEISRKVRQKFPEKFGGMRKATKQEPVDSGSERNAERVNKSTTKFKDVEAGLTEQELSIMKTVMKSTGMTKEKYLEQVSQYQSRKG